MLKTNSTSHMENRCVMLKTNSTSRMERRIVNPWTWQDAWGYVQGNEIRGARRVLVCAGQLSTNTDGHLLHSDDMRGQIGLTLDNLEMVLHEAGFQLSDVVRLNYYTTDVDAFIEAMAEFGVASRRRSAGRRRRC